MRNLILSAVLVLLILINSTFVFWNARTANLNQQVIDNNQKVIELIEKRQQDITEYSRLVSGQWENVNQKLRDCEFELNAWKKYYNATEVWESYYNKSGVNK